MVGKAQAQSGTAAAMAFGILVVVGRGVGADRLAHERKQTGERANGKDERLERVIPGPVCVGKTLVEQGSEATAADVLLHTIDFKKVLLAAGQIKMQYPEMIPYHGAVSPVVPLDVTGCSPISRCSRQACGQKGIH